VDLPTTPTDWKTTFWIEGFPDLKMALFHSNQTYLLTKVGSVGYNRFWIFQFSKNSFIDKPFRPDQRFRDFLILT
jgi:hypothetical protein